jgi:hypothetical protein
MSGKHGMSEKSKQGADSSRNISPSPGRDDKSKWSSAFLADRGEGERLLPSLPHTNMADPDPDPRKPPRHAPILPQYRTRSVL